MNIIAAAQGSTVPFGLSTILLSSVNSRVRLRSPRSQKLGLGRPFFSTERAQFGSMTSVVWSVRVVSCCQATWWWGW